MKPGKNVLTLKIFRWSTGSYLECQDFWRISGIERDVYLYSQPKAALKDFRITSTLDDSYKNGVFALNVDLRNHRPAATNLTLAYEQEHVPTLQGFIARIKQDEIEIKRELEQSDADVVRIMTVHGSKGLGQIAISYGYNRYQTDVLFVTVALLIVLMQVIQIVGMKISRKTDKRVRN